MKTPYDVLGVRRYADDATIRAALRRAAKTYHPDVTAGDAEAERHLRLVIEAYEVLRNPQQKAAYDKFLRRRRREKARRLATTALASAGFASTAALTLLVWLHSPQAAEPDRRFASARTEEPAPIAGPGRAVRPTGAAAADHAGGVYEAR
jgi:curved DNA-binding protein CbpA